MIDRIRELVTELAGKMDINEKRAVYYIFQRVRRGTESHPDLHYATNFKKNLIYNYQEYENKRESVKQKLDEISQTIIAEEREEERAV